MTVRSGRCGRGMVKFVGFVVLVLCLLAAPGLVQAGDAGDDEMSRAEYEAYRQVIERTQQMVGDTEARQLAEKHGLDIMQVTWEDTGRSKGSAWGPNISDMTIQVRTKDPDTGEYRYHAMPVIRFPNFADRSADIPPKNFFMLVGNERGLPLSRISLDEFLDQPRRYLTNPKSWAGKETSLAAERDTHVLVSAQACFLPIPQGGKATFNPALYNYQSYPKNPAVLSVLVTREGSSVTVLDNSRDTVGRGRGGQRLFFNEKGERAPLTGKRLSDFLKDEAASDPDADDPPHTAAGQEGLNMVMVIQIPLQFTPRPRPPTGPGLVFYSPGFARRGGRETSDVEAAVIGHGEVEGPFVEMDDLAIERDPRFPVRVTVQFYKATSNGVISEADVKEIAEQIEKVYAQADYVGSLVVEGFTGRPTEHGVPVSPFPKHGDPRREMLY